MKSNSHSRLWAARISMLAVFPLLLLLLIFLTDVRGWNRSIEYGLLTLAVPVSILGPVVFLIVEVLLRVTWLTGFRRLPWFTLLNMIALPSFFLVMDDGCVILSGIAWTVGLLLMSLLTGQLSLIEREYRDELDG